ncbi:hypothetical protein [Mucilaginibacter inviolabilis]|uniref:hypothetical protein n=1 Tax=Mucilaginibacter inviolabilis TaxID=2714892 RepID=UPI00140D7710|nr:hypothetical protein [Mucilaginibacter inviolabilis]
MPINKLKRQKMLDFYLIDDLQAKPNYPDPKDLKFVGGLDNQTFKRLKDKKIIADRFDYYSDFRWDTTLIKQISKTIHQKQLQSDTDVKQLLSLLEAAEKNKNGLIAYGD